MEILDNFGATGAVPSAGVIMDKAGNFFGTTLDGGGISNAGTAFRLSPSGTITILHSFTNTPTDGGELFSGVIMDKKGNLYGTALNGGTCVIYVGPFSNCGVVFKVDKSGKESVLDDFTGFDGANSYAGLIMDAKGNLYGTTFQGGAYYSTGGCSCGTVFKIKPH